MAHDVFISYSSEDKTVADAVCATLESRKIRGWIAPRDVPAGKPYAASLVNAIRESRVMVLVLSEGSNNSVHVLREVSEAVDNGIPIIPFRIEDIEPSEEMRYYIKSIHWLDAMDPPMERHLNKLAGSVQALLSVGEGDQVPVTEPVVAVPSKKRSTLPVWVLALIGLAVVVILGGGALWFLPRLNAAVSSPTPTAVSAVVNPTEIPHSESTQPPEISVESEWSDWKTLSFDIPNEILWRQSEDGRYTALPQDIDTFAWSKEIIEGDFILNLDITTPDDSVLGFIVVYGDGGEFSDGNLIFEIGENFSIVKHTIYVGGENWLTEIPTDLEYQDQTYLVTIEVIDDQANLYIDNRKVASARIDDEVNRSGMIALVKYWAQDEVTFANIQVKTRGSED